jgi:YVTN family beta-propeller protein
VTAETSNTVSVIDARANRVTTNILADQRPRATAFSPDGTRAYVTNEVSGTVVVVDVRTHTVLRSVEIERGEGKPVGIVSRRTGDGSTWPTASPPW